MCLLLAENATFVANARGFKQLGSDLWEADCFLFLKRKSEGWNLAPLETWLLFKFEHVNLLTFEILFYGLQFYLLFLYILALYNLDIYVCLQIGSQLPAGLNQTSNGP